MECRREENINKCPCTYPCDIKGLCCECIRHHRERGELPACYFPKDYEKTYDRSVESFVRLWQERGGWL